jgi:tetratricopeptide (TPR) repeat protein
LGWVNADEKEEPAVEAEMKRLRHEGERLLLIATDTIRLHRLEREIAVSRRDGAQQYATRRALVAMLAAVYPDDGYSNPASWPRCAILTPHLVAICKSETADPADSAQRADLLGRAGCYLQGRAAYSAARPFLERALAIREKALGPEHPDTATRLNNLALLLQDQGDPAAARSLFERALAICEKTLGPEHPDTATSLNNLAFQLQAQRDLVAARPLFERGLAICARPRASRHKSHTLPSCPPADRLWSRERSIGGPPKLRSLPTMSAPV